MSKELNLEDFLNATLLEKLPERTGKTFVVSDNKLCTARTTVETTPSLKEAYTKHCKRRGVTPSADLRKYMFKRVKRWDPDFEESLKESSDSGD